MVIYRGLYKKGSKDTYKISRSGIESYIGCKRCFYLDKRLGLSPAGGPAFTLNVAVDHLLKKEFDIHRAKNRQHPLMKKYGIDAIPFSHEKMDEWRSNFKGVQFLHEKTNLYVFGAVDDIWVNPQGELIVVDYKATSKKGEITLEGSGWEDSYKRQMEVYQWLLKMNGFKVSKTGYFVYCNGKKDVEAFDGKLEFDIQVIPYKGENYLWIEDALVDIVKILNSNKIPAYSDDCEDCDYQKGIISLLAKPKK